MPTVEERISAVETKVDAIAELRTDMNRQFSEVRSDMDRLTRRVDVLDQRMERHFMWMVSIQFTVLIAVIVALIETSSR
jgi:hypothetical protein